MLISLQFLGNLKEKGFQVLGTIKNKKGVIDTKKGELPPDPQLADLLNQHWQNYRQVCAPYQRIRGIRPLEVDYGTHIPQCEESAQKLGTRFNQWLYNDSFRPLEGLIREYLEREGKNRCLIATEDDNLYKLPWHKWQLRDGIEDFFVSFTPVNYSVSSLKNSQPSSSPKILAILGHNEGINLEQDQQELKNRFGKNLNLIVDSKTGHNTQHETINDNLWKQSWQIIFFAGHSETKGETGRLYLNDSESLTINQLEYAMKEAVKNGLQVAIFNSCDGVGLVKQLAHCQIPYIIVMRDLIPDRVAHKFLTFFLANWTEGDSFYSAVQKAQQQLQGLETEFPCASWLPLVYQHPYAVTPILSGLAITEETKGNTNTSRLSIFFKLAFLRGTKIFALSLLWVILLQKWDTANISPVQTVQVEPVNRPINQIKSLFFSSLLVTISVMGIRWLGWLQGIELIAYDTMMKMRSSEFIDQRISIVEITSEDVNKYGYPISDETLAKVISKLTLHDPIVMGIDIHRNQPRGKGREELVRSWQDGKVISVCAYNNEDKNYAAPPEIKLSQLGFSNLMIDTIPFSGEKVRRQLLSYNPDIAEFSSSCTTPYSFSFKLAHSYLKQKDIELKVTKPDNNLQFGNLVLTRLPFQFGGYQKLDGESNQIMINYRSRQFPAKRLTLSQVLENKIEPQFIKDKIILLGYSSSTARDYFNTPIGELPGVVIHAHSTSQLISAVLDKRSLIWTFPQWGDFLVVLLYSNLTILVSLIFKINHVFSWRSLLRFGVFILLNIMTFFICLSFLESGLWLPFVPLIVSSLLVVSWTLLPSEIT